MSRSAKYITNQNSPSVDRCNPPILIDDPLESPGGLPDAQETLRVGAGAKYDLNIEETNTINQIEVEYNQTSNIFNHEILVNKKSL